jgi:tetratricopeptide (TPR) repeat protein
MLNTMLAEKQYRHSKFLRILLICFFVTLLIVCSSLFVPRFIYQKGITQFKLKNYKQANIYLDKAEQAMPESIINWFAQADLFRIYLYQGQTLYQLGIKDWKENGLSISSYDQLVRAKNYLTQADKIEAGHYINNYWLTLTEESLEKAYAWLFPRKKNIYNAFPYYQKVLPLRPSGITVRHAYARYLQYKEFNDEIPGLVQYMMEIHPPSYRYLKNESFYTDELIPYIKMGLHLAVERNILQGDALKALSDIYFLKKNFVKAISYYKEFLDYKPSLNASSNYIHLGSLYLKNKQYEKSYEFFIKALFTTDKPDSTQNRIYNIFKREKLFSEFKEFYNHLKENGLKSKNLEMLVVKCLINIEKI